MARPIRFEESLLCLNDDCLREIFAHLRIDELCGVADTCHRLKWVAQDVFQKTPKFKIVQKHQQPAHNIPHIIRIFGKAIESIEIWPDMCHPRMFTHLIENCGPQLKSVNFICAKMTSDEYSVLQPIFHHLEELQFSDCETKPSILAYLPAWSPKLRKLEIIKSGIKVDQNEYGLYQNFPELQNAFLTHLNTEDLEEFLHLNPQLKSLTSDDSDDSIFRIVATHVPKIEHLDISIGFHDTNPEIMAHLNQLRSLKSFSLKNRDSKLPAFGSSNCDSLEKLKLISFDFRDISTELTRLKNLTELDLQFSGNLTITHIKDVLIACTRLSTLYLYVYDYANDGLCMSMVDLLDILRYGKALRRFDYTFNPIYVPRKTEIIDADSYMKMINILMTRPAAALEMRLGKNYSPTSYVNNVPAELLAQYKHLLKLVILPKPLAIH